MSVTTVGSSTAATTPATTAITANPASTSAAATTRPVDTIAVPPIVYREPNCCTAAVSKAWHAMTYPIHKAIHYLYTTYPWIQKCMAPVEFVYNKMVDFSDAIRLTVENCFKTPQVPLSRAELDQRQATYWRLGKHKLIEGMERGFYESYGPYVFDRGLHGGAVEPGFKRSWERAAQFLSYQFQAKVDASFYLRLHSYSCDHFMGSLNGVLLERDRVGTFRDRSDSAISWICCSGPDGTYAPTAEAEQALNEVSAEVQRRFGTPLGQFDRRPDGSVILRYAVLSKAQVETIYDYFAETMYAELARAQTQDEKLRPICKFFRNCEYLHSVRDGCGRNDLLIFNFLLTQQGFHPACINAPYLANTVGLDAWEHYVRQGMHAWQVLDAGAITVA